MGHAAGAVRRTSIILAMLFSAAPGCPVQAPPQTGVAPTPASPTAASTRAPTPSAASEDPAPELHLEASPEGRASRPIVDAFRRALVALRGGDAASIELVVDATFAWSDPLRSPKPRDRAAFVSSLRSSGAMPTRIVDLGRDGFLAELRSAGGAATLVLLEVDGARITSARVYGAALASERGDIDIDQGPTLEPTAATAVVTGRPRLHNVVRTRELYDAASARAWTKVGAIIGPEATHIEHADGPPGGEAPQDLQGSLREMLADSTAQLTIRRHHALGDYVIVEAVVAIGRSMARTPTLAFVDVLRLHDGRVVASARYANHRPS